MAPPVKIIRNTPGQLIIVGAPWLIAIMLIILSWFFPASGCSW